MCPVARPYPPRRRPAPVVSLHGAAHIAHGLDRLRDAWNEVRCDRARDPPPSASTITTQVVPVLTPQIQHYVSAKRGVKNSGGRPVARMEQRPHPAGQMQIPAGFDVARYGSTNQAPLKVVTDNAAERDPYYNQPLRQQARALGTSTS